MSLDDVKQFLDNFSECVIATASKDAKPEAATVGLSVDGDFKFLMGTNKSTRKAANIAQNNEVAIVVGFDGPKTLQLQGQATEVSLADNKERIELHFERVPQAKEFAKEEGQTYYLITPTWLRFTDYTQPDPIFETEDFS